MPNYVIACKYCDAIGTYRDVGRGGWALARSQPFAYVCPKCRHKDQVHA